MLLLLSIGMPDDDIVDNDGDGTMIVPPRCPTYSTSDVTS
jgi:hypothetical protein